MATRKRSIPKVSSTSLPEAVTSTSPDMTREFGRKLAGYFKAGEVVYLYGELGSGKTTIVQGIAQGLGIQEFVRSSSFMLVNEYQGTAAKLYHIDLYRLSGDAIEGFGLEEYMYGDGICLIEWADRLGKVPSWPRWEIRLTWQGESERKIEVKHRDGLK